MAGSLHRPPQAAHLSSSTDPPSLVSCLLVTCLVVLHGAGPPVSSGLLLSLAGVEGQLSAGGEEELGELSAPLGSSAVRLML